MSPTATTETITHKFKELFTITIVHYCRDGVGQRRESSATSNCGLYCIIS